METIDLLRSGQLAGVKRLNLYGGLAQFPSEILDLADSLEILDLSDNCLKSLPDEFAQLKKLKIVFFNNNAFEEVPEILSQCPNLYMVGFKSNQIRAFAENALSPTVRWLILTNNRLEQLPRSIGKLTNLQKLMLAGNKLRSLPHEMALCRSLELIRLAANRLEALPDWLFTLPRLSWLAYSGNPFCDAIPVKERSLPHVDWAELTLGETLGQGASGVISKGTWAMEQGATGQPQEVAIKIFKGEITSDGLPADEMRACIAAGSHENLVGLLGKVINHPEATGLVLPLVSPDYRNLGKPPDFDSCTRDTYSPDTAFSVPMILRIAQGIAAAAAHLHSRGIMHSDLYAHNILVNEAGHSLLGDFGAASFYDLSSSGQAIERLEVRAFGCLLEDLLDHCKPGDAFSQAESPISSPINFPISSQAGAIASLRGLQQDCMNPVPSMRPLFIQICEILVTIEQKL
ncbi:MAG: leucine-rich repeat-containing serine/threonine-protein kinase [Drouetiella hepatica Uher 2000/2452]|jgi:hypothetical protein|uniref:Leucine-rich repeat-containing serine/threonine-protein kinase n=1 Tax=Drouetiella hepatica Uher 2000/2452 TaxID=904376 RepID=A0A951UNY5_9CYAN|nr:leucine-rich repeat-containing serine/threonine-protein kinase [Drouetiella hepatica Uher 2000/2452]